MTELGFKSGSSWMPTWLHSSTLCCLCYEMGTRWQLQMATTGFMTIFGKIKTRWINQLVHPFREQKLPSRHQVRPRPAEAAL